MQPPHLGGRPAARRSSASAAPAAVSGRGLAVRGAVSLLLVACCVLTGGGGFVPPLLLLVYLQLPRQTLAAWPRALSKVLLATALVQLSASLILNTVARIAAAATQHNSAAVAAIFHPLLQILCGVRHWRSPADAALATAPPAALLLLLVSLRGAAAPLARSPLPFGRRVRFTKTAQRRVLWGVAAGMVFAALCSPSALAAPLLVAFPAAAVGVVPVRGQVPRQRAVLRAVCAAVTTALLVVCMLQHSGLRRWADKRGGHAVVSFVIGLPPIFPSGDGDGPSVAETLVALSQMAAMCAVGQVGSFALALHAAQQRHEDPPAVVVSAAAAVAPGGAETASLLRGGGGVDADDAPPGPLNGHTRRSSALSSAPSSAAPSQSAGGAAAVAAAALLRVGPVVALLFAIALPTVASAALLPLVAVQTAAVGGATERTARLVLLVLAAFGVAATAQFVAVAAAQHGMVSGTVARLFIPYAVLNDSTVADAVAYSPIAALSCLLSALVLCVLLHLYRQAGGRAAAAAASAAVGADRSNNNSTTRYNDDDDDEEELEVEVEELGGSLAAALGDDRAARLLSVARCIGDARRNTRPGYYGRLDALFVQLAGRLPSLTERGRLAARHGAADMLRDRLLTSSGWWQRAGRGAFLACSRILPAAALIAVAVLPGPMDGVHFVAALLAVAALLFPGAFYRAAVVAVTALVLMEVLASFLTASGLVAVSDTAVWMGVRARAVFDPVAVESFSSARFWWLLLGAAVHQLLLAAVRAAECRDWADACTMQSLRDVGFGWSPLHGAPAARVVSAAVAASSLFALLCVAIGLGLWWPPTATHEALLIVVLALCAAKAWGYPRLATLIRIGLVSAAACTAAAVALMAVPQAAEVADAVAQQWVPTCARPESARADLRASCLADAGLIAPITRDGPTPPPVFVCVWLGVLFLASRVGRGRGGSGAPPVEEEEGAAAVAGPTDEPFLCLFVTACVRARRAVRAVAVAVGRHLTIWGGWAACAGAALAAPGLLHGVYLLGFLCDFRGSLLLAFCLRHLVAVYGYQLNFIPAITATIPSLDGATAVPVDALVGLVKQRFNTPGSEDRPENVLPALHFVWRQTLIAVALIARAATEPFHDAEQSPEWRPTRRWAVFLLSQIVPACCFIIFAGVVVCAMVAAQAAALGVVFGAVAGLTAAAGTQTVSRGWRSRVVWFVLALCVLHLFFVRLDGIVHVLPLPTTGSSGSDDDSGSSGPAEGWRWWLWEGNAGSAIVVLGAVAVAAFHQCRHSSPQLLSRLAAQRAAAQSDYDSLVDHVRAAGVRDLLALRGDRFALVVPDPGELLAPSSCFSRVATIAVRVVAYVHPVALTSLLAGAASPPSVLGALLLVGSLLLAANAEWVQLRFFRVWRPIARLYVAIPVIALSCRVPGGVGAWVQRSAGWIFADGPFFLTRPHAALLVAAVAQTAAFNSFYFADLVRRLHRTASTRVERYEAMQARLAARAAEEVLRVSDYDAALRQHLELVRRGDYTDSAAALASPLSVRPAPRSEASGDATTAPERATPPPPPPPPPAGVLDAVTAFLAARTFRPEACAAAAVPHRGRRLVLAAVLCVERHTALVVLLVAAVGAMYTGCLWEVAALCYVLGVVLAFYPFAPRWAFQVYMGYTVAGIVLKASASVYLERVLAHDRAPVPAPPVGPRGGDDTHPSDLGPWLRALSWVLLDVTDAQGFYWGRSANYMLAFLDFLSFAMVSLHKSVCVWEGVYRPSVLPAATAASAGRARARRSGVTGDATATAATVAGEEEGDDLLEDSGPSFAVLVHDADSPGNRHSGNGSDSGFVNSHNNINDDDDDDEEEEEEEEGGSGSSGSHPRSGACGGGWAGRARAVCACVAAPARTLWRNAVAVHGIGRDYYTFYTTADAAALLALLLLYGRLSGSDAITLQDSLANNLLPGPLAALILLSVVHLIAERAVYVRRAMQGKVLLNSLCAVGYCGGYWLWRHMADVQDTAAGNVYFALKIIALTFSVWQTRRGFPRHRRRDPFTPYPGSAWKYYGYQALRLFPFLWEARTFIDWTVQTTALRLEEYMVTDELYDTVYRRQVQLFSARWRGSYLGRPVGLRSKLTVGASRVALVLVAVLGPLLYYSSLNPSVAASAAGQLRVRLSFMGANNFFSATALDTVPTPGSYRAWLSRTRPSLSAYGLQQPEKTLQLMQLGACSSELWLVSPEALRETVRQLREASAGGGAMYILQSLALVRQSDGVVEDGGGGDGAAAASPAEQLLTTRWPVPAETAATLLRVLEAPQGGAAVRPQAATATTRRRHSSDNTNSSSSSTSSGSSSAGEVPASGAVLESFYSPFIFSRGSNLQVLPASPPPNAARNRNRCALQLHVEEDAQLGSAVRYWCLACDPLFSSGNVPTNDTALYPEWPCLDTGRGCEAHDREDAGASGSDDDARVPFYAVVLTDPVVAGVSFLRRFSLVALYSTFVLALGRLLRSVFAGSARALVQTQMHDPTAVGQLLESISIARDCGELALEQAGYLALVDLMRSPERLHAITGASRSLFREEDGALQMPTAYIENEARQRWLHKGSK